MHDKYFKTHASVNPEDVEDTLWRDRLEILRAEEIPLNDEDAQWHARVDMRKLRTAKHKKRHMEEDNYYRTRSCPLAQFLSVKGHPVEGINTVGRAKETEYIFKRVPGVELLAGLYRFAPCRHPALRVSVRELQRVQRELLLLTRTHKAGRHTTK